MSDVVVIWLEQKSDQVNEPTDPEQTKGEQVENTHAGLTLVEFVRANTSQEQTKEKSGPLGEQFSAVPSHDVGVGIGVGIVDDNVRLGGWLNGSDLTSAM